MGLAEVELLFVISLQTVIPVAVVAAVIYLLVRTRRKS